MGNYNVDILAVVPARAGSKRLPGKNLLDLHGKPLIRWTLEAALESQVVDQLVVSSDDDAILAEGIRLGLHTIRRPVDLASDTAATVDVLVHTLESLAKEGVRPARLMLLQPTSPLRKAEDIYQAVQCMDKTKAESIISVCRCEHSPLWSNTLEADGFMDDFLRPEILNQRSQDLPVYYRLNGAIYLAKTESFLKSRGFFMRNSQAFIMPTERSIDIDTPLDFKVCEYLYDTMDK
ncbi:acylneuraminate cytidylyltransferase family protein [Pseudomonas beijingensis]|jgi:CMP-N-acetylneuraminic acid synthetase|uniref:Acylneuraminate cytidylyltransferase family protein n=1 Tax=Pseudomonas beijingensis TaxID=2954101 RepID=A0ABY9FHQ6_9PSED|nr:MULTISPECIES: acylneuraminate cytidylyltransferase family protein [unclassified Pseudomonas]WLH02856.1 acylneuraminate cytidylyltransferase family protein [Pseudomonas sp. FP2034]WLI47687.1 acylneuraminate cytidylyltransferase family protein [Pseudomonas sp. FP830]